MKELILSFALTFSQDFNTPLPPMDFQLAELDTLYGMARKENDKWMIYLNVKTATRLRPECLKSLVYHELGHAVLGLPDTNRRGDMMNPYYCVTPYKRLRKLYE